MMFSARSTENKHLAIKRLLLNKIMKIRLRFKKEKKRTKENQNLKLTQLFFYTSYISIQR